MKRYKLPNYQISQLHNPSRSITQFRKRQSGYILITLMLFVALLAIATLAVLPEIKLQLKRDREEELRHRGTAYMRAIQHFYKKTGRYPVRLEDLESTNNIRFVRKRYKDPMSRDPNTGGEKDFKLLHVGDINLYGQTVGQGLLLQPVGQGPGQAGGQSPFQSAFGGPGVQGGPNVRQFSGAPQPVDVSNVGNATPANSGDANVNVSNQANPTGIAGASPVSGPPQANALSGNNPQVFGGGPILGVASTSKDKSVREFGDKYKHYNEWLFIYDPTADRGGLILGPVVPNLNRGGPGTPVQALTGQGQGQGNPNPGQGQGYPNWGQPQNPAQQQGPPNPQPMPPEQ